jgi:hypothetical protein
MIQVIAISTTGYRRPVSGTVAQTATDAAPCPSGPANDLPDPPTNNRIRATALVTY